MNQRRTIYFEEEYGVSLDQLSTINDIDDFIEKKFGHKLEVKNIGTFPIRKVDIDKMIDKQLNDNWDKELPDIKSRLRWVLRCPVDIDELNRRRKNQKDNK